MKISPVHGEGQVPSRIMIVGERPGYEENRSGHNFVGPAGDELWDRLWRICGLDRDDVFVCNLVRTFSKDPPTQAEISQWSGHLYADLVKVKPEIIVTVGYHAARHFLPQFRSTNGDYFHGLVFPYEYGQLRRLRAFVVPLVHSSAALRQPSRYQQQFSDDCESLRRVIQETTATHRVQAITPYRTGLAPYKPGDRLSVDTEFHPRTGAVQAVTLTRGTRHEAALIEPGKNKLHCLTDVIEGASSLVCHMAKAEMHSLRTIGIDLSNVRIDDTMLKAYLLGLPQSLKVLAFRLLGWQLTSYEDLIAPVDDHRVRSYLEVTYGRWHTLHVAHEKALKGFARRNRKAQGGAKAARKAALDHLGPSPEEIAPGETQGQQISKRALSSLRRILDHRPSVEAEDEEGQGTTGRSARQRWQGSVFAPLAPLPQEVTWVDVPQHLREPYALTDPLATLAIDRLLTPQIKKFGLRQVYEIDRAVLPFLVRNEQIGMAVDVDRVRELGREFLFDFNRICQRINRLAGHTVNPLSGPDVSTCLFEELGITPTRKTPTGKHFTTQDKYLKARKSQHEIVPLIVEARQLNKYKGTYTDRLPDLLKRSARGIWRYHPDWKYTRTATGRLAEEIIVLIPKHTARGTLIRNCFGATEGHDLVSVDLSQIELRAMAHLSRDKRLLDAYTRGEDIHAQVAHDLLGAPRRKEDQDESLHRLPAKTINFGIINGMTEYGMLDQLHEQGQLQWTIDDVRQLLKDWFKVHAGVDHYWRECIAHAKRTGYVADLFGRRRYIAGVLSTSEQVRRESERQCLCAIQATADGISKIWNKKIWRDVILPANKRREYCEPWVRIHDDTTLETDRHIAKDTATAMLALVPQLLSVPTLAEAKHGTQWGDLHKFDKAA